MFGFRREELTRFFGAFDDDDDDSRETTNLMILWTTFNFSRRILDACLTNFTTSNRG